MHARPIQAGMVLLALATITSATAEISPRQISLVPWRVLESGAPAPNAPLVLFWLPSAPDELKRSELVVSERLTVYAGRCVAMYVVRAEDEDAVARLSAGHKLPLAVLVERGTELGRVDNERGVLRVADVEAMVRSAVESRQAAAGAALSDARKHASAGETEQATSIYRAIAAQRCMFPREAKAAARALKKLGLE